MHNSKLIRFLKNFSRKELRLFNDFVKSPYFNNNTELVSIFEYIKKFAPLYKNKKLFKENVYMYLYPERKFNEKHLGYLSSDLIKLIEKFVALNRYNKEPILPSYHQLLTYNEWDLDKQFKKISKEAFTKQNAYPYRDTNYFFNQYLLADASNQFFTKQKKRKYDESIQEAADNLDLYYLSTKLKYCCEIINRKNVVAADYQLKLLNEITSYLKENPIDDIPAIAIYHQILMTLLESDKDIHYTKLKNSLNKYADKFPIQEARDMYAYAQNYCIRKINSGYIEYYKELFYLYKIVLEKEIIFVERHLSHWTYKNIASIGLRLKQFEWVEKFINDYKHKLSPEFKETAYAYNMANLYFYHKKYGEALRLLLKVEFQDVYYHLDTKLLMLKIYYEINEIESLFSLIDAFKIYLKRNKFVPDSVRKTHNNFLTFAKKAIKIPDSDYNKIEDLEKQIKSTKEVVNIPWLLEKLSEKKQKSKRKLSI